MTANQRKNIRRRLIFFFQSRLEKLGRLSYPSRVRLMEREFAEDWVHDTGRLVLVGNAAHPHPVRLCAARGDERVVLLTMYAARGVVRSGHEPGRRVGARQAVLAS